jgi:hypothetical protein
MKPKIITIHRNVLYKQVYVIGGDHVVEHTEAISLLCLEQPS